MTLKNLDKAPFPWFGGKSRAAETVWASPHCLNPINATPTLWDTT